MSVHEPEDISVAYQDSSQCWAYFRHLASSLFPINEIKFQFDIGEFSMKKFRPAFYPINDPFLKEIDSPIKVYKRPYIYIYFVTFLSNQEYVGNIRTQLDSFVATHENKQEGDEKDEWLIVYTTPKPITSEAEYVK